MGLDLVHDLVLAPVLVLGGLAVGALLGQIKEGAGAAPKAPSATATIPRLSARPTMAETNHTGTATFDDAQLNE